MLTVVTGNGGKFNESAGKKTEKAVEQESK